MGVGGSLVLAVLLVKRREKRKEILNLGYGGRAVLLVVIEVYCVVCRFHCVVYCLVGAAGDTYCVLRAVALNVYDLFVYFLIL